MKSMLLIDSSPLVARLFAELFEARGWNVTVCGDRDRAEILLLGAAPYSIVMLGHCVTERPNLVRFIRSLEHRLTTAIVILAENMEEGEAARMAGADEYLEKPVNPKALVCAVDKHVK